MKYRSRQELRRAWVRRKAGEDTDLLAAEMGVTGNMLRRHWREHLGVSAEQLYTQELQHAAEVKGYTAYCLRVDERMTYREMAEHLGLDDPAGQGSRACWSALDSYCRRIGIPVPKVKRRRRRCAECSEVGHDTRTCRRRKMEAARGAL